MEMRTVLQLDEIDELHAELLTHCTSWSNVQSILLTCVLKVARTLRVLLAALCD
jgi:hypothetical protein